MRGADLRPHIDEDKTIKLEKGETVVRVSDTIDGADDVRKSIFKTLGVLDLEPHKEGIILDEDELKVLEEEVLPKFPDLHMHAFWTPKVPGGIQLITVRNNVKRQAMDETNDNARVESAEDSYPILHSDNPNSLPDRAWAQLNQMESQARQLARKVGVKFVQKGPWHFYYNGYGIEWRNGGENLISEKKLREWMTRVDAGEFNEDKEKMTG